jgi:hypothetical protein
LLALDGLDQGRFFTTNIGAGSTMDINVEIVSGTAGVFTNETGLVCFVDGLLQMGGFLEEFTADVDVGGTRVHTAPSYETAFDKFVGVPAENFTVLAGARLPFVGVHDEITGSINPLSAQCLNVCYDGIPGILFPTRLVHKAPFETRGETGTATATKAGILDGLDDPGVAFEDYVLCAMPVAA